MASSEAMTSSTHSFAYSYRCFQKCFVKICETSKCHNFLIFQPIFSSQGEQLLQSAVRRASSVNFLHFHLLLENARSDFNKTWQESSSRVGVQMVPMAPMGALGEGPQGSKQCQYQTSSSPELE